VAAGLGSLFIRQQGAG